MNVFDKIVQFVLRKRKTVLFVGALLFVYGVFVTSNSQVDILPDLNRPTITIFAEAEGLATEEVEVLVTNQIENVMNGAPGVERVRSISTAGLTLVFVEFDWNQEIYRARQIVSEKLNSVSLPDGVEATLGPISSIMGEIQLVGLVSESSTVSESDLRSLADWTVRPKLLTIPGIASVTAIGGEVREYQILVDAHKLASAGIEVEELEEKLTGIIDNKSGGFFQDKKQEYNVRIIGNTGDVEVLKNSIVGFDSIDNIPIVLGQVATVIEGAQFAPRGAASVNGRGGVIMSITKQPGINTLELTKTIDETLAELDKALGDNISVHANLFRQEKFIRNGIDNVVGATRDAAILVIIVLVLFLGNVRALSITLAALPFSFVTAILILKLFGIDINVMTLGGLAVAIGELTDDAVVGVENTIRWLKENNKKVNPSSVFEVVWRASSEVRGSVIFSTILVVLVFMPLFALGGIEGRLLAPLGIAYIVALIASTVIAMTMTVVLSYWLLPTSKVVVEDSETFVVRYIKKLAKPIIRWSIRNAMTGLILAAISIIGTAFLVVQAGKDFLPPFNEGTLTIGVALSPGSSLTQSERVSERIEKVLVSTDGVKSTARRTGRAEEDEHANGVHISEFEVDIDTETRTKDVIIEDIRNELKNVDVESANISIGQPISHRIEHILSGVRAPLVIKLFGQDLDVLVEKADEIREILSGIEGTLNPIVEKEIKVPQVSIVPKRSALSRYGFTVDSFSDTLEVMLAGENLGKVFEGNRSYNMVLRMNQASIDNPKEVRSLVLRTPSGELASISQLAEVTEKEGRSSISHDNGQRRLVISSGILDGDSVTIIDTLKKQMKEKIELPDGYFVSFEGTYKSQKESSRRLILYSALAFLGIIASLYYKFGSISLVLQVLINIPVTYFGAMIGVFLTGNVINLASLVGLISLLGLAARNGILLIEHWIYKATEEGEEFGEEMIVAGSLNRLTPMLMTSLTSMLALLPLMLAADEPGKEILYPLAVVSFGGILVSMLVEVIVRPGMFWLFGKKATQKATLKYKKNE